MTGSESHKGIQMHWNDVMLRRGYNPLTAYKQSKLCDILFAKGLNDRYSAAGLCTYVLDPGLVRTDIGNKAAGGIVGVVWTLRKRHGVEPSVQRRPTPICAPLITSCMGCITICAKKTHIVKKSPVRMPTNCLHSASGCAAYSMKK